MKKAGCGELVGSTSVALAPESAVRVNAVQMQPRDGAFSPSPLPVSCVPSTTSTSGGVRAER